PPARRTATPCREPSWPHRRSIPFQRSLFPFVNEADDEQSEKHTHRGQTEHADRVERDGPREKKRDLESENDEEDRDEVVTDVEAAASVPDGLEAALVRRQFLGILAAAAAHEPEGEQPHAERAGHAHENQDRQVVCKHTLRVRVPSPSPRTATKKAAGGESAAAESIGAARSAGANCINSPLASLVIGGADGRTRTDTACATAPSRQRVYQFHHIREKSLVAFVCNGRRRSALGRLRGRRLGGRRLGGGLLRDVRHLRHVLRAWRGRIVRERGRRIQIPLRRRRWGPLALTRQRALEHALRSRLLVREEREREARDEERRCEHGGRS